MSLRDFIFWAMSNPANAALLWLIVEDDVLTLTTAGLAAA